MFLLLILPVLVSGYIAFTQNPYHYYRLHRYEGQLLYLESAKLGFFCTLASSIIVSILNKHFPSSINLFGFDIPLDLFQYTSTLLGEIDANTNQLTWISLIILGSLIVCKLYVTYSQLSLSLKAFDLLDALSCRRFKLSIKKKRWISRNDQSGLTYKERAKIILMASVLKDSPIDALFLKSYVMDGFYLMLTMEDRKVYIGRVISLGEPNETEGMDQEIVITPYASGYRDEATLSLKLTVKYTEVTEDVSLVLRQDKIISATQFSEALYDEFLSKQKSKKEQPRSGLLNMLELLLPPKN
ncbi:hypothetical protein [Thalassotalea sp. PLHSN55]|uniref:hypothetical protein n=1 Tax=Thalassotalea sp. PLHSN55 TaxID=3435888 RepID=UPI003F87ACE1